MIASTETPIASKEITVIKFPLEESREYLAEEVTDWAEKNCPNGYRPMKMSEFLSIDDTENELDDHQMLVFAEILLKQPRKQTPRNPIVIKHSDRNTIGYKESHSIKCNAIDGIQPQEIIIPCVIKEREHHSYKPSWQFSTVAS